MKIITISREFGSGGREFGKRLAELLGYAYYDKEIIHEIAERTDLSEDYVDSIVGKKPVPYFPITIGRSFYPLDNPAFEQSQSIYHEQSEVLKDISKRSHCVIVGRCADYILEDQEPTRLFIYSDLESKIKRCRLKASPDEGLSAKELKKKIKNVDKNRSSYYEFYTGQSWGEPINYDFMINTGNKEIKEIVEQFVKIFQ